MCAIGLYHSCDGRYLLLYSTWWCETMCEIGLYKIRAAGGAPFCTADGGGKPCATSHCTSAAVSGGVPFCRTHDGGKRCSKSKCTKSSAKGAVPFCTAHGGGKRCSLIYYWNKSQRVECQLYSILFGSIDSPRLGTG